MLIDYVRVHSVHYPSAQCALPSVHSVHYPSAQCALPSVHSVHCTTIFRYMN